MKNLDITNKTFDESKANLMAALNSGDEKLQQEAFEGFLVSMRDNLANEVKTELGKLEVSARDEEILVARGTLPALTSEERKYFAAAVEKKGFDNIQEEVFPKTIMDQVFKDITEKHPLISEVNSINTQGIVKWIKSQSNKEARGYWGQITDDIKQIILNGFESVEIDTRKLSGFVAVPKAYFDLGPAWLAKFVTMTIYEIFAVTLEEAIVNGDGKDKPIGMMMQLSGAVDGVYPEKPAKAVTDFDAKSMAGFRAALAEAKTDNGQISLVVHPETYWLKVFPLLNYRKPEGQYINDILPTGERIVKTYAVPKDKAILGNLKNYDIFYAGHTSLKRYDQTLAIEDMDLFIYRTFVMGMANDPNAFFVLDLSGVDGATKVELEEEKTEEEIGG